jgi:hypothetical protein
MELENIILSEVKLRRPKISCSSTHVDYRPKRNVIILLDMDHAKRDYA